MAKNRLAAFPPELREKSSPFPFDDPAALETFRIRSSAAFRALARHYRLDPGPPPPPNFWPELAMALAADFVPAFYWQRKSEPKKRGRQKIEDYDALEKLLSERKKLRRHSDSRACELIAKQWAAHPKQNPFGRKLSASTLRDYLQDAPSRIRERSFRENKPLSLRTWLRWSGWRPRQASLRK